MTLLQKTAGRSLMAPAPGRVEAPARTDSAFDLLESPDAEGREALAMELARDVAAGRVITAERARTLLAISPRAEGGGGRENPTDLDDAYGEEPDGDPWDSVLGPKD